MQTQRIKQRTSQQIQWNPVNTDGVRIKRRDKRNCPQYPGVRIKRVSVERGSTVQH